MSTAMRRGIKNYMKQKLRWEKLPEDKNIRVCNLHFEEERFERDLQVYSIYMPINIYHIILANLSHKVWLTYSEFCDSSCVFNYRSRHRDLCYSIVILHVSSRILENACERKSSLLIKL